MDSNTSADLSSDPQVARILYKEVVEGDLRKIEALSNDSDTGGGARDFRFGSYKKLLPAIRQMFPTVVREKRRRKGVSTEIDVYQGEFYWQDAPGGSVLSQASYFESPTDARPSEGRIVRVHESPCFDISRIPKGGAGNRVLLLLIQQIDGAVWPHFVEEASIRTPGAWDPTVAEELISCLDAQRAETKAVIGFRDFLTDQGYCNGK